MDAVLVAAGLTLQVAATATALALLPACAVAYVLARSRSRGRAVLSAIVNLPLVLPPTAIGFLLLRVVAVDGPIGRGKLGFDPDVLLTWRGAVLASAIFCFPLIVRVARRAFESVDPRLALVGRTLGLRPWAAFMQHTLPLALRGLAGAALLGFARAAGEFGATLTIAAAIPGETQTVASAIYAAQQAGHDGEAFTLVVVSLAFSLVTIFIAELLSMRNR